MKFFRMVYRYSRHSSRFIMGGTMLAAGAVVTMNYDSMFVSTFDGLPPWKWMCAPVHDVKLVNKKDSPMKYRMEEMCMQMQAHLCRAMEDIDGKGKFLVDKWDRKAGGGGISCVMQQGQVFEKAGVNISSIDGTLSPAAVRQMKDHFKDIDTTREYPFNACGISCVVHPGNPHVPTVHFNFRYFEVDHGDGRTSWWFGGGADLTPYFLVEEDAKHFHSQLKAACDAHNPSYYPAFKKWCDNYFVIEHRGERRGVGGIFFDDINSPSQEEAFQFVRSCALSIANAYLPLVRRHKDKPFTQAQKEWQLLRRGRYVEFNLVYDRGTKFGLATKEARIESILMSLPLYAKWEYCHDPSKDPEKQKLMDVLVKPRDWIEK